MQRSKLVTVVLFTGMITSVFLLNLCTPDQRFSYIENRNLQMFPELSIAPLLTGQLSNEIETYVSDQWIFRDYFIEVKSEMEFLLGKDENNGVMLSSNETLIERFEEPDYTLIDRNIDAINTFSESVKVPVYTTLIPTQSEVHKDLLVKGAPTYSQNTLIAYTYSRLRNTIHVEHDLKSHKNEYIFYNTDHHWTTLGAYYGYKKIIEDMGGVATDLSQYTQTTRAVDFNGTIYNKSGIRRAQSDVIFTYVENQEIMVHDGETLRTELLYQELEAEETDKYTLFLGGNNPLVTISGTGEGKLLIIKDSYTNSMVPFFIPHYEEIHLVDLRFKRDKISDYVSQNHITEVLICYSVSNFVEDRNLQLLT